MDKQMRKEMKLIDKQIAVSSWAIIALGFLGTLVFLAAIFKKLVLE